MTHYAKDFPYTLSYLQMNELFQFLIIRTLMLNIGAHANQPLVYWLNQANVYKLELKFA